VSAKVPTAKFRLGKIVTTPNALSQLSQDEILVGIQRHQAGDWGDVSEQDRNANDRAVIDCARIWSVYLRTRTRLWCKPRSKVLEGEKRR